MGVVLASGGKGVCMTTAGAETVGGAEEIRTGSAGPAELVRRARFGCAESFGELAERYRPRLVVVLEKRLGQRADAEDVAQEALARAYEKLDTFDDRYRFSTWLYAIALRLASDYHRRESVRRGVGLGDANGFDSGERGVAESLADREGLNNIWRVAREALNENQYTAMWLRYGEGMSPTDVAEAMGKSGVGIRVLLHRARGVMGKRLRGAGVGGADSAAKDTKGDGTDGGVG